MTQPDKSGCDCFYTACSAAGLVCGVYLIVAGAWWGWPISVVCVIGMVVAMVNA